MPEVDPRIAAARQYVARGWPVFVLGRDKRPLPNCPDCAVADWTHDRETCTCLHCHGFYAATLDLQRVEEMCRNHPGLLAVRTGAASGLVVIDAEGTDKDDDGQTGVELLEQWEVWSGGWSLPPTLMARNFASDGMHLYYNYPEGTRVRSRNRILPNIDVKSDGGYVAVPCGIDQREWETRFGVDPVSLPPEAVTWLQTKRSRVGTHRESGERPGEYSYERCLRDGPGAGERDFFFNDVLFRQRVNGVDQDVALEVAREIWLRVPQDPTDPWPFEWVEYKSERIWRTVPPNDRIAVARRTLAAWMDKSDSPPTAPIVESTASEPTLRVGRATFVRRERRMGL